jgi:hypothetical protein
VTTRIAILVEGATEAVFKPPLLRYLQQQLEGNMPKLDFAPQDGRLAKGDKLRRQVELLLKTNDAVVALTDVYTGTQPPDFASAEDAKAKMCSWVGPEPRFYPHAAQYEFEAWLLPYWPTIQRLAQNSRSVPAASPETVNHQRPPSRHLAEVYRTGGKKRAYSKTRDATAILRDQDLSIACNACPELKAFVSTILSLCGASPL